MTTSLFTSADLFNIANYAREIQEAHLSDLMFLDGWQPSCTYGDNWDAVGPLPYEAAWYCACKPVELGHFQMLEELKAKVERMLNIKVKLTITRMGEYDDTYQCILIKKVEA